MNAELVLSNQSPTIDSSDNGSISMQTIQSIPLKELCGRFELPAVQRGLVWDATRIGNLWDSLAKGYPIGSFIAYQENDRWQLLDGQQRLNSILIAFNKGVVFGENNSSLWVKMRDNSLSFMVCTPNNPWGFQEDGSRFSAKERVDANKKFLGEQLNSKPFEIAMVANSFPWEGRVIDENGNVSIEYVPMSLLCEDNRSKAFKSYGALLSRLQVTGIAEAIFSDLYIRIQALLKTNVCVIVCNKIPNDVVELFQRINKGGERLSSPDEVYSTICAFCGSEIKTENNRIAQGFMPPERVVQLALRMGKTLVDTEFCDSEIDVDKVKRWFSDTHKYKYCDKIRELYRRGNNGHTESIFATVVNKLLAILNQCKIPMPVFLNKAYCWESWMLVLLLLIYDKRITDSDEQYYPLLIMLPYIITGTRPTGKADAVFSSTFYNAASRMPRGTSLLANIAIGLSCVMLKGETFAFPWPEIKPKESFVKDLLNHWIEGKTPYLDKWIGGILKYGGTEENPLLFYHQREYIKEIIEGTRFNPAFRCATDARNRPWDMDHIFPDANWDTTDNERNTAGNIQVMYFSDNRGKGNRYNGYSAEIKNGKLFFGYSVSAEDEGQGLVCRNVDDKEYWKEFIGLRLHQIVFEIYEQFKIQEVIDAINRLPVCAICKTGMPNELTNAIERYAVFSRIAHERKLVFSCIQYRWKQQSKNIEEANVAAIPIGKSEISFYESLTPWLGLYPKDTGEKPACQIWAHSAQRNSCEMGIGRPFDMSSEQWRKIVKSGTWYKNQYPCELNDMDEKWEKLQIEHSKDNGQE